MIAISCRFDSGPRYHVFLVIKGTLQENENRGGSVSTIVICSSTLDLICTPPELAYGGVAQMARAFGSYPKGRGFDSLRRYHLWTRSSVG